MRTEGCLTATSSEGISNPLHKKLLERRQTLIDINRDEENEEKSLRQLLATNYSMKKKKNSLLFCFQKAFM